MSIMTILLSSVLMACSLKKAEASFSQNEIVVLLGDDISLDDYLNVVGVDTNEISYRFSNPFIVELNGRVATAQNSGKTSVYATYQNNNLASMQIVVKKNFSAPTDFSLSETGLLSWGSVFGYFENEETPTIAQSYVVEGTRTTYLANEPETVDEIVSINETVSTNSFQLTEYGVYSLTVSAQGTGYFDDSMDSQVQTLYYGYMTKLTEENLNWNSVEGTLSWSAIAGAKYKVEMDNILLDDFQTSTTKDLSDYFDSANAGPHSVSVLVYDDAEQKIAMESEELEIVKLDVPTANYVFSANEGGLLEIKSDSQVQKYQIVLKSVETDDSSTISFENSGIDIKTNLNGLASGVYEVGVSAINESGLFYASDAFALGKIYKMPALDFVGIGDNEIDGTIFKAQVTTVQSLIESNVLVLGLGNNVVAEGLSVDELSKNISVEILQSGKYDLSACNIARSDSNQIAGEDVYVINSDASTQLNVVKVSAFDVESGITHSYVEEKSVLTFEAVENATNYDLYLYNGVDFEIVDEEKYLLETVESSVSFKFIDKIESLFKASAYEGNEVYQFKVVAKTDDDKLAINSSLTKTLTLLSAPTSAHSGNSTVKTYTWNSVDNADGYRLEIYEIDKDTYESNQEEISIDVGGLSKQEENTVDASYTFSKVGYYYVKVFAVSNNANEFISSIDCLEEVFYIAEQLVNGTVQFGYDADYLNHSGFTASSGYFVKVANAENIDSYELTVGSSHSDFFEISGGDFNIYLLSEDFSLGGTAVELSIVGHAQDETIYVESNPTILSIERLTTVAYEDLVVDELTTTVTIKEREGVTGGRIWESDNKFSDKTNGEYPVLNISDLNNFSLVMKLYGTDEDNEGIYHDVNGKVYLDSAETTLNFSRLQAPNNLRYYDGSFTFEHVASSGSKYYVLDLGCSTPIGDILISVKFDQTVSVVYNNISVQLGPKANFISNSGNNFEIKLSALIDIIKTNEQISGIYNQVTDITFSLYAYQTLIDGSGMILSSPNATIYGDAGKTELVVEKMLATQLSFSYSATDYTLSWEEIDTNALVASETAYQIYMDDVEYGSELVGTFSYSMSSSSFEDSTYYNFYVKVSNPYYLESDNSNIISIYKLKALSQLTLTTEANLSYEISTSERDFCDYVEVKTSSSTTENTTGEIAISGSGDYTLKVVGKKVQNQNSTIFYIDSPSATWTLAEMETIKPTNIAVTFANNVFSWERFGQNTGIESLNYIVIFKDLDGKNVIHKTQDTSVNLTTNTNLYESISSLRAGDIEVEVSAYLDSYTVYAGGTIYYALDVELLNGEIENNHWLYSTDGTIKKLTTPEVVGVEFVYDELANAQFPNIQISFVGNYGNSGTFSIYINDNDTPVLTSNISLIDEKYTFTLTRENYNNSIALGGEMTVKIMALSSIDIPSSEGSVDIQRTVDLQGLDFEAVGEKHNQNLIIKFDPEFLDRTAGGVVLQVTYQENGGEIKTEYLQVPVGEISAQVTYDMSDFFSQNLANGGSIKVSGFINNYADDTNKLYYLAPPIIFEGNTYNVLNQVETVTKESGGFTIDSSINNLSTIYVVEYGDSRFEVSAENGKFYFVFPNSWTNGNYDLTIYATENGYVNSVANVINFGLNRIDSIKTVTMERDVDDMSKVILSWDEVSNATGYILNVYAQSDVDRTNLLYSFDSVAYHASAGSQMTPVDGKISYSVSEIFGEGYQDLLAYGKLTAFDLLSDINVVFVIVAVGGSGLNNSLAFEFNGTIKGNGIQTTDIMVDTFGSIVFASQVGTTYIYRFVDASGSSELQTWKVVEATAGTTRLDSSSIVATGTLFNVEIIAVGSAIEEPASSADYIFVLDSVATTTVGNDLTFVVNDEIYEVGYHELLPSSLAFTMTPNSFTSLFAGLTEDAILTEDVVSFVPTQATTADEDMRVVYAYSFINLIGLFEEAGYDLNINSNFNIYFWSYRETTNISGSYVVSKPYTFTFSYVTETQFVEVKKVGDLGEDSIFPEDYVNTFAIFNDNDVEGTLQTLGFFVRVTQLQTEEGEETDGGESFSTIKFLTKEQITGHDYFYNEKVFSINLTEIFEQEDLKNLTGIFLVEFAKLQVEISTSGENNLHKFVLSDWLSASNDKVFEFERLPAVRFLNLSAGDLYWSANGEKTTKYYVYFIQDLNGDQLGEKYNYFATTNTYFNASEFVGTENSYYLAVQGIAEDPFLLSSIRSFIVDEQSYEPVLVYKNQINTPLKLKDGKLYFDWNAEGDFYKLLTGDGDYSQIVEGFMNTVFTSPFTFTVQDLVNNNIYLRIRFTSLESGTEGIRKSFDINAIYLLSSLIDFAAEQDQGFDVLTRLDDIYANAGSSAVQDVISRFRELVVENGSFGIANSQTLFDDLFESVQMGSYKVEYCLLGNVKTLNSSWYTFANDNGENVLYVNGEPIVKAFKVENVNDISINSYQLLIKKSQIHDYLENAYVSKEAESYNLKIYDDADNKYVFAISKGISNWNLTYVGGDVPGSVSVYETDSSGQLISGGDYLMVYLNQNNGDSIMGRFGDEIGSGKTYKMQIYAVGTNFSTSSKSEFFSLTLLGFNDTFSLVEGEFVWGSVNNRKTTVIYKKNTSSEPEIEEIDGNMVNSKFSLDGLGYGLYDYIKFVLFGEVRTNSIFVDSEIYQVSNVYKLATPTLSNTLGYIAIDDSANIGMLGVDSSTDQSLRNCYSDGNLYNYILYNTDETVNIKFSDANSATQLLYYEAGITGIDLTNPDYFYKNTEEAAREFHVASLGSTAGLNIEADLSLYYLNHIYCKDVSTGESTSKSIALRSGVANINASMLDSVQNVTIENSVLKWNEVTGKSGDFALAVPETGNVDVVYKITVVQYRISNTDEDGETETNVGSEYYYYTTNNSFDFAIINEDQIVATDEKTYLKATVQALALVVTDRLPSGQYVSLVEGGYAYGNVQYEGTDTYVLMGNGAILRSIDRFEPIDTESFEIVDGSLYWSYTTNSSVTDTTFFEQYSFVVTDSNGKEVSGSFAIDTFSVDAETSTSVFRIKFTEDPGALPEGQHVLHVYVTQGSNNDDLMIKSFGRTVEILKLGTVTSDDFIITSDGNLETLDFENYFLDQNSNNIVAEIKVLSGSDVIDEKTITFTREQYRLYVLRDAEDVDLIASYPEEYVTEYIVISEDQTAQLLFEVKNFSSTNVLYSDLSEEFVLQRSNWGEDSEIVWNEETQTFSWQYTGQYSFKSTTVAEKVREVDVLVANTILYVDSSLQESSDITLRGGDEIVVESVTEESAQIFYQGETYYISLDSYQTQRVVEEEETFGMSTLFRIISNEGEKTLIQIGNVALYLVDTSAIVEPVYIVEVTYGSEPNQIERTYVTTEATFTPTIISDQVRLKVSIKLGNSNIQSKELVFTNDDLTDFVSFDLFESGSGTAESPYVIVNNEQFRNLEKRMSKDENLINYTENGIEVVEEEQYYFSLQTNIVLSENGDESSYISGTYFSGNFDGIIEGNENTISYISSGVARLSQGILVSEGFVLGPGTETSTTFNYGTALFETLSEKSSVRNLNIDVTYGIGNVIIPNHSLMAGLAITNSGRIENVTLVGFNNSFVGYSAPNIRIMMIYSGLVSKNEGVVANISNSSVETSMILNDGNQSQVIMASGIAFMNFATIENCEVGGDANENYSIEITCQRIDSSSTITNTIQVAGVVITNSSSATLRNCSNYFDITVECAQTQNQVSVYVAGVADYGKGEVDNVFNYGSITTLNISAGNLHQGDTIIS